VITSESTGTEIGVHLDTKRLVVYFHMVVMIRRGTGTRLLSCYF
jgi:hypothetical protein